MTKEQLDRLVDRFLSWRLPQDFAPDGGITFKRSTHLWPVGTNLLTAHQAKAMLEHILADEITHDTKEAPSKAELVQEAVKAANFLLSYTEGKGLDAAPGVVCAREVLRLTEDNAALRQDIARHAAKTMKFTTREQRLEALLLEVKSAIDPNSYWYGHLRNKIDDALAIPEPASESATPGWKLVPLEPTEAMLDAGCAAWDKHAEDVRERSDIEQTLIAVYQAMYHASSRRCTR